MDLRRNHLDTYRGDVHRVRLGLLLMAFLASGCQSETVLGASEQMWMWLAIPLLGFGLIGAFFVWLKRHHQIVNWRIDQGEPPVRGIVIAIVVAAVVPAVVFIVQNLRVEIDPRQQLWNIGLWLIGSIAGSTAALLIGLRVAEPKAKS
jgi:ABC-type Fe3+-siderophore transport system permease subunit